MTQSYISSKQVLAWEQEQNGQPGYAVKYEDGYTSWCPKEAFEKANVPIGHVDHLPAFHQRMIGEAAQLADRLLKLNDFVGTDTYEAMEDEDKRLLLTQALNMALYLRTLTDRIERIA